MLQVSRNCIEVNLPGEFKAQRKYISGFLTDQTCIHYSKLAEKLIRKPFARIQCQRRVKR